MNVHFVIHEAFEAPGAFEDWVEARGFQASYSRVYQQDGLPDNADLFDLLVVLGGPQSPATTHAQCAHFDAFAERNLINTAISAGRAVIGVCLGAQLIGEALGAPFSHSPEQEIGKFPIVLTEHGLADPAFSRVGQTLDVGHWHNDMPGLTADARVIAYSEGCPRQIIAYSPLVYGLQCHLELTGPVVELLIQASAQEWPTSPRKRFVQSPAVLGSHDYTEMNQKLFVFLDALMARYQATGPNARQVG